MSRCDKSYKMGEVQEGGKTFRVSVLGGFDLCKTEHEKEHVNLKGFCILFENAKTCRGPHACLPTSCLARRSSRLWLPAQLQGRLSLRISFSPSSTAVPFLKEPKPWAQAGLRENAMRAGAIPSAQPGPSALRGGPCFKRVNQQRAPKGSPFTKSCA